LTRASCSVRATAYLSKSRWRFLNTNVTSRTIQTLTKIVFLCFWQGLSWDLDYSGNGHSKEYEKDIRKNLAVIFSKTVRCHCSPITYSMWNVQEKQRKQTPSWSIFDIALSLFCYTIYYWCSYNKGDFHKIHVRTLSYIPFR
jgi:hypothetical protein